MKEIENVDFQLIKLFKVHSNYGYFGQTNMPNLEENKVSMKEKKPKPIDIPRKSDLKDKDPVTDYASSQSASIKLSHSISPMPK